MNIIARMPSFLLAHESDFCKFIVLGETPLQAAIKAGVVRSSRSAEQIERDFEKVNELLEKESIQAGIAYMSAAARSTAANEVAAIHFDINTAASMYMNAYAVADTAGEMVRATDSLVKLFDVKPPEKVNADHSLKDVSEAALYEMVGNDVKILPQDYQ